MGKQSLEKCPIHGQQSELKMLTSVVINSRRFGGDSRYLRVAIGQIGSP